MIAEKHRNVISVLLFIFSIFYLAGAKVKKKRQKSKGVYRIFFGRKGWIISSRSFFYCIYAVYRLHVFGDLCSVWTAYEPGTNENLTEISAKTWSIKINIVYSWQNGNNMATTNDYITILRKYLSAKADAYGITKIGIFGSVARNEQTEDSDVDVCVEMKRPDLFTMVHIKEELQELFGKPVDIVRLRNNMNPMLLKQIKRDGIYA